MLQTQPIQNMLAKFNLLFWLLKEINVEKVETDE